MAIPGRDPGGSFGGNLTAISRITQNTNLNTPMALDQPVSRRSVLSVLGLVPALRLLGAQQQDKPTFSTGVKVVNLFANVRNKNGAIVKDLTKNDFLLD